MTKQEALDLLWKSDSLYYLTSPLTHLPYVEEDREMGTDEVWMYTTEEEAKTSFDVYKSKMIPVQGNVLTKPQLQQFYFHLRTLGVDMVVICKGLESCKLTIDEVMSLPSEAELKKTGKQIPPMNQALQLSGIFFRQAMSSRQVLTEERKEMLEELYEDLLLEIGKAEFFLALQVDPKDPRKVGPLVIRKSALDLAGSKNGKVDPKEKVAGATAEAAKGAEGNYVALFSDPLELNRLLGPKVKEFKITRIPYSDMKEKGLLPEVLAGVCINPAGIGIILNREKALEI